MSRLAVATTDALVVLDRQTLKDPPAQATPGCSFLARPTAIAWAQDNSCLYLSLPDAIEKYDPSGAHIDTVYPTTDLVSGLVSKDKGRTVIFAIRNEVTVLDVSSRKVLHTFNSHRHSIVALALSSDASLLATISHNAVHVHNLAQASHTILRGFPAGTFTACAFHPHDKTRLLLGVGLHLAVYDTTRTSGPVKAINFEKGTGDIVGIASSPFSKTLVALACSTGNMILIDLEKEKGIIRTVPMNVPLTSLVFSPEGAAIYVGTEDGRILFLDLRALDKPPKEVSVSGSAERVVCLAIQVQKKPKAAESTKPRPFAANKASTAEHEAPQDTKPEPALLAPSASGPQLKKTASTSSLTPTKAKPKLATSPRAHPTPGTTRTAQMRAAAAAQSEAQASPARHERAVSSTTSGSSSRATATTSSRPPTASSRTTVSTSPRTRKVSATGKPSFSSPPISRSTSGEGKPHVPVHLNLPKAKRLSNRSGEDDQMLSTATTSRMSTASRASTRQTLRTRTVSGSAASTPTSTRPAVSTARSRVASGSVVPSSTRRSSANTSATVSPVQPSKPNGTERRPSHSKNPSAASSVAIPHATVGSKGSRVSTPVQDTEQLTSIRLAVSRAPSPDLALPVPAAPVPLGGAKGKAKGSSKVRTKDAASEAVRDRTKVPNALGLGAPEIRRWAAEGELDELDGIEFEARAARVGVGFLEPEDEENVSEVQIQSIEVLPPDKDKVRLRRGGGGGGGDGKLGTEEATIKMRVQISPRRPAVRVTPSVSPLLRAGEALPLPGVGPGSGGTTGFVNGQSQGTNPAHELLHAIVRDALYDFRRETKAEIIGLHLDIVKMGRSWRKEMREALEKWGEELQEVREENARLREENERLRRGY